MKWQLVGVALFALPLTLSACAQPEAVAGQAKAQKEVALAQSDLRLLLKDPGSAQWGAIWSDAGIVCGRVNAKNGFGGYTGFKRFFYLGGTIHLEGATALPNFDEYWENECSHAEYTVVAGEPAGPTATGPLSTDEVIARLDKAVEESKKLGVPSVKN